MFQLHEEQVYVRDIAHRRGIPLEIITHEFATDTCAEKAALLGWPVERVVKAVYFYNDEGGFGIVTPETGSHIPSKDILVRALGLSGKQAGRYRINGRVPPGMERGTCTPFPLHSSVRDDEVRGVIVLDRPDLEGQMVDISLGGKGVEAHQVSMHIPYQAMLEILMLRFPGRAYRA